jgi:hypothetical protein
MSTRLLLISWRAVSGIEYICCFLPNFNLPIQQCSISAIQTRNHEMIESRSYRGMREQDGLWGCYVKGIRIVFAAYPNFRADAAPGSIINDPSTTLPRLMPPLRFLTSILFLYLSLAVNASSLTTTIAPNERVCFYADVDKAGEKIGVCAHCSGL